MNRLKVAIQKTGRLQEESINLLKDCGIKVKVNSGYTLKTQALNFPIDIFFLRDDDIPKYIQDRVVDIGIVGKNVICEQKKNSLIKENLGFGSCKLSIAVPEGTFYKRIKEFSGKCIATNYPNLLKRFLKTYNICFYFHKITGSIEVAPNIEIADAICDLVSSGETLFINKLKEIKSIFTSEAVLIYKSTNEQNLLAKKLILRIKTVIKSRYNKFIIFNISNNKLDKIIYYLNNPVILPFKEINYSQIQSIVSDCRIWNLIEIFKKNGAKYLFVFPIQKNHI